MNRSYKPLIVAVFLAIGGLGSGALFLKKTGTVEVRGVLGGPSSPAPAIVNVAQGAEMVDSAALTENPASSQGNDLSFASSFSPNFSGAGTIQDPGQPVGPAFDAAGMVTYIVQKSDTLASVASAFGVSTTDILTANPGMKKTLKAGEVLNVLPTSGVVYQTQDGDTLASIATNFNIPQSKILQFNQSVNFSALEADTSVIIPGGTAKNLAASQASTLPNFNSDFIMPAKGYDWGILHNYNAVDIANSCGTPVVAAAEGVVISDPSIPDVLGGWNGGYGNFVLIEHPFGNDIRTRYAHLEQVMVQVGDYVKQGQEIGLMGETGDATGCHVHFEVIGAQQPFAK
jgi:murein DD-endopeptidase MepM/ murein hydrolase activator NlpD